MDEADEEVAKILKAIDARQCEADYCRRRYQEMVDEADAMLARAHYCERAIEEAKRQLGL